MSYIEFGDREMRQDYLRDVLRFAKQLGVSRWKTLLILQQFAVLLDEFEPAAK
jgi:hypothetical protein